MSVHLCLPIDVSKCKKIIVSIHGVNRNSRHYRNIFIPYLYDKNILVLAPRFKAEKIRHKEALIYGNAKKGKILNMTDGPKENWTFSMIGEIIDILAKELGIKNYEVDLFGHSAGAQFVHRLPYFYNLKKLNKIIIANPGWFTLPDDKINFPIGIKDLNIQQRKLKELFCRNIILLTGQKDIDTKKLNKNLLIMQQGKNRHERAINYFNFCKQLAEKNGYEFNWSLIVEENLSHSAKQSAKVASRYII